MEACKAPQRPLDSPNLAIRRVWPCCHPQPVPPTWTQQHLLGVNLGEPWARTPTPGGSVSWQWLCKGRGSSSKCDDFGPLIAAHMMLVVLQVCRGASACECAQRRRKKPRMHRKASFGKTLIFAMPATKTASLCTQQPQQQPQHDTHEHSDNKFTLKLQTQQTRTAGVHR